MSRPTAPEPRPGFALFVAAFFASPLILVAWAGGQALLRATGWPRWRLAAAAVVAHFSGLLGLLSRFGQPRVHLPFPGSFLWPQIALSVPVGLLAASLTRSRDLVVPDPAAAVREQRRQVKLERKARAIAARQDSLHRGAINSPLAKEVAPLGGDLPPSWRSGKYVVLPDHTARLPELAIGQSGAGKSTYIGRRVFLAAGQDRQVIALDGKGDRGFVQAVTDAYLAARPGATIHVFLDQPLDGWRGDPAAQVNRLPGCSAAGPGASRPPTTARRACSRSGWPAASPARPSNPWATW